MPHKLLIEHKVEPSGPFTEFLEPGEVVRGRPFVLTLSARNLADSIFPGASSVDLVVEYSFTGINQTTTTPDEPLNCPEIAPGATVQFYKLEAPRAVDSGTAWVTIKMTANDGEEIEYYQSLSANLGTDRWANLFYVVSSELVRIISLLDKISRRF